MNPTVVVTDQIGLGFGSIHAETTTKEEAENNAQEVAGFLRKVDVSSPCVCIDGRCRTESQLPFELGPHVAGGAMTLLVAAEAVNHPFRGVEMLNYAKENGFDLRAHDDDTNRSKGYENGTGCGANDKLPTIGVNFLENKAAIGDVMASLMGSGFDAKIFESTTLPTPSESEWDKNFLKNSVGADKLENLHDDSEGVHGHKEQMVIFNTVPNTTIDRDAYFEATGKQVFTVDLWYIKELSSRLATGSNAAEQATAMEHAMIAYQVATYLTLCDGSHRAVVLTPEALPASE